MNLVNVSGIKSRIVDMFQWFKESIILKFSILNICENKWLVIRGLRIFFLVLIPTLSVNMMLGRLQGEGGDLPH